MGITRNGYTSFSPVSGLLHFTVGQVEHPAQVSCKQIAGQNRYKRMPNDANRANSLMPEAPVISIG